MLQLQSYWHRLPLDPYLRTGERCRRYSVARYRKGLLRVLPEEPHLQSLAYNKLFGGLERRLAPIEPGFFAEPVLREILVEAAAALPTRSCWRLQLHQFRIKAPGKPTPEGVHRDGADFVLMVMLGRDGVTGGITTLYGLDNDDPLIALELVRPGQALLLDDRQIRHYVSPIAPLQDAHDAFRDMLVITFHREADLPDNES